MAGSIQPQCLARPDIFALCLTRSDFLLPVLFLTRDKWVLVNGLSECKVFIRLLLVYKCTVCTFISDDLLTMRRTILRVYHLL